MKKILSCLAAGLLLAALFGCSQQKQWNHQQRRAVREALRDYRRMPYVEQMSDTEFTVFSDDVAIELENDYPAYATFIQLPAMEDTVEMTVVETIVARLDADPQNMRYLYPYDYLVEQEVLPAGLDREQQRAFYACFAGKIDQNYDSMEQFFDAILADTTDTARIARFQQQCASDLFGWSVFTEIDIFEE